VTDPTPLVLVSVGTDVHPFDRLVSWIDAWAAMHPSVAVFQQIGNSNAPRHTPSARLLPIDELRALMARATVVITHGGPATIADARRVGRRPIVVPRHPGHGEHVDGHQQRYAAHVAATGRAFVAQDRRELHDHLDDALADPYRYRCPADDVALEATIERFGGLVAQLAPGRRRRRPPRTAPPQLQGDRRWSAQSRGPR
jgi:UDP-N-acetylglucosamine transferase subunit ALG13